MAPEEMLWWPTPNKVSTGDKLADVGTEVDMDQAKDVRRKLGDLHQRWSKVSKTPNSENIRSLQ